MSRRERGAAEPRRRSGGQRVGIARLEDDLDGAPFGAEARVRADAHLGVFAARRLEHLDDPALGRPVRSPPRPNRARASDFRSDELEHRLHLRGQPRQDVDVAEDETGRAAALDLHRAAALGELRPARRIVRSALEPLAQAGRDFGLLDERELEGSADRLAREVVGSAAEPAGDDQDVRVLGLHPDEGGHALLVVRERRDQDHVEAERLQPSREPRAVRVGDVARDELVPDGHNGRRRMSAHDASMEELRERRAFECRLTPDRALQSLDEAEEFLLDRGLLTRTADSALPSLFEACHEEPYAPESPGFGQWPRTNYPWFGELGARGYPVVAVHCGKNVLATPETVRLLDPICRAELERLADDVLLRHLAEAGPSELDDLQLELGLKPKELKQLRAPLERCGAVVSRSIVYEEPHRHTSELSRWDHVVPEPLEGGGLGELVVAGVRAAVLAPEGEVPRWFSWRWYWEDDLLDRLVAEGRLVRPEDGWLAAP